MPTSLGVTHPGGRRAVGVAADATVTAATTVAVTSAGTISLARVTIVTEQRIGS
jgi:hypothetical protein